jgi:myo-inositol-1(or 4)-monophosphatase
MNSSELDEIFEFVKDLVIKSGEALKEGFLNTGIVRTKTARHDLVTVWDEKVEDILINGIKKKYPTHK